MDNDALDRAAKNAQAVMRSTRTWDPETEPTPIEWTQWFRGLSVENAECVAYYLLMRMADDDQCFLNDHVSRIKSLESTIGTVQTENRELRGRLLYAQAAQRVNDAGQ